jgi:twitching motility protein PilT
MISLEELLKNAVEKGASDIHITVGLPPMLRINGKITRCDGDILYPKDTEVYVKTILNGDQFNKYDSLGEADVSYAMPGIGRFRVNVFKQRGSNALVLRLIALNVPTLEGLKMPPILKTLTEKNRGLVLVTGPTGSGKSTTLAAMVNEINSIRHSHIITLEDPIEYLHRHNKCIVNQREVGNDTNSYANALRAVLREDPDVILVGEMRDLETIGVAITAAETGHLVFSTLHTIGASKTIDRVIDVFPSDQQQQIKVQLAAVLEGVVSQQLIERADGEGRACALEIMITTPAIRNLIREGKTHQIDSMVQTGTKYGMKSMDMSLVELFKKGVITEDQAINYAVDEETLSRQLIF